ALERYNLYFLDSVTIGNTQAMRAAQGTGVKVIKRKVFLDDSQNEADIRDDGKFASKYGGGERQQSGKCKNVTT
ncbi:divergent polysaccharide deacetylase family protein, partial [Escherichia sp. SS-MK2]